MSESGQKLNPYDTPIEGCEREVRYLLASTVLFFACIAMALVGVAVSGHAIQKILETTPFMGISVDASGNRIPIQGYPQLGLGLIGVLVFTVLAIVLGIHRAEKRNAS